MNPVELQHALQQLRLVRQDLERFQHMIGTVAEYWMNVVQLAEQEEVSILRRIFLIAQNGAKCSQLFRRQEWFLAIDRDRDHLTPRASRLGGSMKGNSCRLRGSLSSA